MDLLKRGSGLQMAGDFVQHDGCTLVHWEPGDSGAHCRKGNRFQAAFRSDTQGMRDGTAQRLRGRFAAKLHTRSVNHVAGFQPASTGNRCVADRDAPNLVAFALDVFSALATDRSRNAAAKLQVIIRGVDNRVGIHIRQVALLDLDFLCESVIHVAFLDGSTGEYVTRNHLAEQESRCPAMAIVVNSGARRGFGESPITSRQSLCASSSPTLRSGLEKLPVRLFVVTKNDLIAANHDRPSNQIRGFGHELDGLRTGRRLFAHILHTVEFVARIQKWFVIARSDQHIEFRFAQAFFIQIAGVELGTMFKQETSRFAAGRSSGFCEELNLYLSHEFLLTSIAERLDQLPPTSARCRRPSISHSRRPAAAAIPPRRGSASRGGNNKSRRPRRANYSSWLTGCRAGSSVRQESCRVDTPRVRGHRPATACRHARCVRLLLSLRFGGRPFRIGV